MANPKHLKILRQGVDVWNRWREDNRLISPDFYRANLRGAILRGADFDHANLLAANLQSADLCSANLNVTNLCETNLCDADLSRAELGGAELHRTKIANTNFYEVRMGLSYFTAVDLSKVRNLETVIHYALSSIDIDTIYKSRGNIPEEFLRGCGVPEILITYMPSLVSQGIEFYSCFISHSSKDAEFLRRLYADLQSAGVRSWYAVEDLKIGDKFRDRIDESVRLHDKLLLVLSENSVSSQWVEKEVETALEKEREQKKTVLFPVQLDDAVTEIKTGWAADIRRTRHIGDFREWKSHDSYRKAFERLMRDLKAEASR
jgi:hypothetical protein